jgi:ribosome-associated toxin RatA of RatAB toxin-antitoxin module
VSLTCGPPQEVGSSIAGSVGAPPLQIHGRQGRALNLRKRKRLPPSRAPAETIAMLLLTLSIGIASVPSATAAAITVTTYPRDDAIDIRASALLNADATTAWRVLTDYGRYTEFIPDLHVSRVLSRHDALVIVEQSGDAALWAFKLPVHFTFEVTEFPPNRLQSRTLGGSLPALESTYVLEPTGATMQLKYVSHVSTGHGWLGTLEQSTVEKNISRQFQALADEIERQDAASRSQLVGETR